MKSKGLDTLKILFDCSPMNDRERQQIELIARQIAELSKRAFAEKLNTIYSDHSALGRLRSGLTIRVAIEAISKVASDALDELIKRTVTVCSDANAFTLLSNETHGLLDLLAQEIPDVVKMASGNINNSAHTAADKLFDQIRADIETKLSIAAFDFDNPSNTVETKLTTPPVQPPKKKGGRPPAEFWDDMWAEIAAALYNGDLAPKSQADVERAMIGRIEGLGFSAAESTVRGRARRLWDRLSALDT